MNKEKNVMRWEVGRFEKNKNYFAEKKKQKKTFWRGVVIDPVHTPILDPSPRNIEYWL